MVKLYKPLRANDTMSLGKLYKSLWAKDSNLCRQMIQCLWANDTNLFKQRIQCLWANYTIGFGLTPCRQVKYLMSNSIISSIKFGVPVRWFLPTELNNQAITPNIKSLRTKDNLYKTVTLYFEKKQDLTRNIRKPDKKEAIFNPNSP